MEILKRYGSVVSLSGGIAYVFMRHENECSGDHNQCPFKDSHVNTIMMKEFIITANNKINSKIGQFVEISVSEKNLSRFAFLLFIFPLLMISLGAMLGYFISDDFTSYNNLFSVIGGIFGLLLSIYIIRLIEKRSKNSFNITKVIA